MSIARTSAAVVKSVVEALAKERTRQRISKNRLAEMSGLSLTAISYFERGLRSPTLETVVRVSQALNVNLGALIESVTEQRK